MSEDLLLGPDEFARTIRRLAHEILENNHGPERLVLVGLLTRGYPIAQRIAAAIEQFEQVQVPVGSLDIALYRDDVSLRRAPVRTSEVPQVEGNTVVLVDDVLFTGRSVRAAMDALLDYGRPAKVRLAVIADRGHRELPIRPDFVGKNVPTSATQTVNVRIKEVDGVDGVYIAGQGVEHARRD